jgi:hypothetical protein
VGRINNDNKVVKMQPSHSPSLVQVEVEVGE